MNQALVVKARSMPGNPYDGHTLREALEQAAKMRPEMVFDDRGYCGAEVDSVQISKCGPRRDVAQGMKAMIKQRISLKPSVGDPHSDLDEWLADYNVERTHQGKMCCGRTPMQTPLEAKASWHDKITTPNN